MMTRAPVALTLAVLTLTLSDVVAPDDTDQDSRPLQSVQLIDPAAGGAIASAREWRYLTDVQKCEALADAEKINCIDAARKKYGEM